MKFAIFTLLTAAAVFGQSIPSTPTNLVVLDISASDKKATLQWDHPTAYEFWIVRISGGKTNVVEGVFYNTHRKNLQHTFKRKVPLVPGHNTFQIQAAQDGQRSDWSSGKNIYIE